MDDGISIHSVKELNILLSKVMKYRDLILSFRCEDIVVVMATETISLPKSELPLHCKIPAFVL